MEDNGAKRPATSFLILRSRYDGLPRPSKRNRRPWEAIAHNTKELLAGCLCQLISVPFIISVVGWLLIPFIMRQRVTSAYEFVGLLGAMVLAGG